MREIREDERLGPSTGSIVDEAKSRGIPWIRLNRHSLVQLGYGVNQHRIQATVASTTSSIAVEIACDKEETKNLLEAMSIPVPRGRVVYDEEDLVSAIHRIGYPLVVKPVGGNHGRGATINIKSWEEAVCALFLPKKNFPGVVFLKIITPPHQPPFVLNFKFCSGTNMSPSIVESVFNYNN